MSRRGNKTPSAPANEPRDENPENLPEVSAAELTDTNDDAGDEPGGLKADATTDPDTSGALPQPAEGPNDPLTDADIPAGSPTHMTGGNDTVAVQESAELTGNPVALRAAADAERLAAQYSGATRNAYIAERRPPDEGVTRTLVVSNDHLDRSGDNVTESPETKIVLTDSNGEARMIDLQPEGQIDEEFDTGSGIRQTNLK